MCHGCVRRFDRRDGIWRFLREERVPVVERFLADYLTVRRAEGRRVDDADAFRALPVVARDHPLAEQWRMRTASWRHVNDRVVSGLPPGRRVLDLGAGVGWLSHRLAELGHQPLAVDLSPDGDDGLGSAVHQIGPSWPLVQAEFDALPLADRSADLAVFNASFHYSSDPTATLLEARRVLGPGGLVVVMDSPHYRAEASGQAMVAERRADFERRFGTSSDGLGSIDFLTDERLAELSRTTGVQWERSSAWYGLRWWARPHRARVRGRREPSRFVTLVGRFG